MFKYPNYRESNKFKTKVYKYTITKHAPMIKKEKKQKQAVPKVKAKKPKRFLDNNTIDIFTAYGFLVLTYPHFFKLINETTGNAWDWYWNKGALLRVDKLSYKKPVSLKYGNFLDPEDVALTIKKYDI